MKLFKYIQFLYFILFIYILIFQNKNNYIQRNVGYNNNMNISISSFELDSETTVHQNLVAYLNTPFHKRESLHFQSDVGR